MALVLESPTERGGVFISYARGDGGDAAGWLEQQLRRAGVATWRDVSDLSLTADFTAEIEMAIRACRLVVLCVTPNATRPDSFVGREE